MASTELREQLRRLGVSRGLRASSTPARRRRAVEDLLDGQVVTTDRGPFFLYSESHPLDYRHGDHALGDLLALSPSIAACLARDQRLAGVELRRTAFIDTETTGLAGGTGTYLFLVGVGLFEQDCFTIRQFFMRDFSEEPAQLQALGELLDTCEAVVSFNGKHFDLPLLETRFVMARQRPRLSGAPHLDLLPTSRVFWKHRLESCALSSLEAEVLGVRREQADVPGWLIPSLYVKYIRTGNAREMPRIFYHNAQDILSLVSLAVRQCTLLEVPPDLPGEDLYGVGRFLHELGHLERAQAAFERSARTSRSAGVREEAMRELAYLLKRQERREEALCWWQELAETAGAVYACEELAKYFEWHAFDLSKAAAWTRRGMAVAELWPAGPARQQTLSDLEHRLQRLLLKL